MNIGSIAIPFWAVLLVAGVLLIYAFGWGSKIVAWGKTLYTKATGKEASGGFVDALDSFVLGAESFKVQQALRIAQREFIQREDTESIESIDVLLARAAVWKDKE